LTDHLKLMCVLAHPDDESLGVGGSLAKYASEGVQTYLVTATRGERGRFGSEPESPGLEVVGRTREKELREAAEVLGLRGVDFLDYTDGDLDKADPQEAIAKIVGHFRRIRPHVVVTFGPDGGYGHPDHVAISQLTTAACACAADPEYGVNCPDSTLYMPHRVSKLYFMAWTPDKWSAYQAAFKDLKTTIDGVERRATPWPNWAITTVIDTTDVWSQVWRAVSCHKTQLSIYSGLKHLPEEYHQSLWGTQEFYRAYSCVNGGRTRENDLFEGLR
jgi:LmbE family N-acetylglucosaminyl deacetylase